MKYYANLAITAFLLIGLISQIQAAFEKLLTHPKIDPEGYCVEYLSIKIMSCAWSV